MTRKYKKLCWVGITFLISILLLASFYNKKTLTGSHLFQNIIGNGQYTLYITPTTTGYYDCAVYDFNKDIIYEVYDTQTDRLVSQGSVGYTSEGYRPFIEMYLKNDITYAVNLRLVDKNTFGLAHIELCD